MNTNKTISKEEVKKLKLKLLDDFIAKMDAMDLQGDWITETAELGDWLYSELKDGGCYDD